LFTMEPTQEEAGDNDKVEETQIFESREDGEEEDNDDEPLSLGGDDEKGELEEEQEEGDEEEVEIDDDDGELAVDDDAEKLALGDEVEDEGGAAPQEEGEGVGEQEQDDEKHNLEMENATKEIAQLDNDDDSDDEDFKEKISEKIREIVFADDADLANLNRKIIMKLLKKEFGSRRVKKFKKYAKVVIKDLARLRVDRDRNPEDEMEEEYHEEEEEDIVEDEPRPKKRARKKKSRKTKGPVKKNKSAYLFFTTDQDVVDRLKRENPGAKATEMMKLKATAWKQLTDEQKEPYQNKASEDKERYETELKEWQRANPDLVEEAERQKREKRRASKAKEKKKRKRRDDADEDDDDEYGRTDYSNQHKTHLEQTFDKIKKSKRTKKNAMSSDDIQEEALKIVERMRTAALKDVSDIESGQPAVHKLQMLPEVVRLLKTNRVTSVRDLEKMDNDPFVDILIEKGILSRIGDWLRIGPNNTLPHKRIRSEMYRSLLDLNITEDDIIFSDESRNQRREDEDDGYGYNRNSGTIAKVLIKLWKHPKETKENRIILTKLIQRWMRMISQRSDNYVDLKEAEKRKARDIAKRRRELMMNKREVKSASHFVKSVRPMPTVFDFARRPRSQVEEYESRRPERADEISSQQSLMKIMRNKGRKSGGKSYHKLTIGGDRS